MAMLINNKLIEKISLIVFYQGTHKTLESLPSQARSSQIQIMFQMERFSQLFHSVIFIQYDESCIC